MAFFQYGPAELDHLKSKDKKLGRAIERIGMIRREVEPDLFSALVNSIVSQQISAKAAATVRARLLDHLGDITPQSVYGSSIEAIKGCGMSLRKAGYIKGIADAVMQERIVLDELEKLPDQEVVRTLSSLNGIGVWTAEMILIFSMERPDVVSWGDLAIRRGMMNLYGLKDLEKEKFEIYRKRYSPYGSVASLYLWSLSHEV